MDLRLASSARETVPLLREVTGPSVQVVDWKPGPRRPFGPSPPRTSIGPAGLRWSWSSALAPRTYLKNHRSRMDDMDRMIHRFSIGQVGCTAVSDGHLVYAPPLSPLPANLLFANAPHDQLGEMLREYGLDLQGWGEWTSSYTCLLIKTGGYAVLVDTGAGDLGPDTGRLLDSLALDGTSPEDVDMVVITHAHPDHLGGNTDDQGRSRFPRAEWVISEQEWDFWTKGQAQRELPQHGGEAMLGYAGRNLSVLKDHIRLVNGEMEILPGILVIPAPGHTPGQLAVRVSSRDQVLYYLSDVVLHPLHVRRPQWVAAVDMLPGQAVVTRESLLRRASVEEAVVMSFHFPFPGLGRILPRSDGWEWERLP